MKLRIVSVCLVGLLAFSGCETYAQDYNSAGYYPPAAYAVQTTYAAPVTYVAPAVSYASPVTSYVASAPAYVNAEFAAPAVAGSLHVCVQ